MSSRELSTVGDASEWVDVIVVAGDAGGDGVELESVCVEVMAWGLGEVFMFEVEAIRKSWDRRI